MDDNRQHALIHTASLLELDTVGDTDLRGRVVARINDLISKDFNRLIHILYRIDVDEQKLKQALRSKPDRDAAEIICDLLVERQAAKRR